MVLVVDGGLLPPGDHVIPPDGLDGVTVCRAIRRETANADVPVLMLTARGYVLDPETLAATNIREVMSKPFSAREILRKACEIVGDAESASSIAPRGVTGKAA